MLEVTDLTRVGSGCTRGRGVVLADLPVSLPQPRDQTATKEMPEFVKLRAEVSRLVRSHATSSALLSAS